MGPSLVDTPFALRFGALKDGAANLHEKSALESRRLVVH